MALILTTVMLMLIISVSYLLRGGFQTNIINRKFSTVYEAANAGVEHSASIINSYLEGGTPADVGLVSDATALSSLITTCSNDIETIKAKTADGKYMITSTLECLGSKPIPGYGGVLRFPPLPPSTGGGTGNMATNYLFFSIIAKAEETSNAENIGQTEAIYRAMQ